MKQKSIAVLLILVICSVTIWVISYQYRFFIEASRIPTISEQATTSITATPSSTQTQDISIPIQPTQFETNNTISITQTSQYENEQNEQKQEDFGLATIQTSQEINQTTIATTELISTTVDTKTTTNEPNSENMASEINFSNSEVRIDKNSALADGKDKITITITLKDQNGNLIKDKLPEIEITGQNNTLSEIKQEEDSFIVTLSSTFAEEKTIIVKVDNNVLSENKAIFKKFDSEVTPTLKNNIVSEEPEINWWYAAWWFWLEIIIAILLLLIVVLSIRKRLYSHKPEEQKIE